MSLKCCQQESTWSPVTKPTGVLVTLSQGFTSIRLLYLIQKSEQLLGEKGTPNGPQLQIAWWRHWITSFSPSPDCITATWRVCIKCWFHIGMKSVLWKDTISWGAMFDHHPLNCHLMCWHRFRRIISQIYSVDEQLVKLTRDKCFGPDYETFI